MPKISIIVCVYNTPHRLLKECLTSLTNQTETDKEIILIDDGSTLDYSKMLKDFPNVIVKKTENRGTLSARLLGIELAKGQFVAFADSDDFVSPIYYQAMIERQKQTNADIVINDWAFSTDTTKYFTCQAENKISNFPLDELFSTGEKNHSYFDHNHYVLWNKIYKKEILESVAKEIKNINSILDFKLLYSEDVLMNYFAYKSAKMLAKTSCGYYFYRVHSEQETRSISLEKHCQQIKSIAKVFSIVEQDLTKSGLQNYLPYLLEWKNQFASSYRKKLNKKQYKNMSDFLIKELELKNVKKYNSNQADKPFSKHKLLPNNIDQIDKNIIQILNNSDSTVFANNSKYAKIQLSTIQNLFNLQLKFSPKKFADIVVPKDKNTLRQKITHNHIIYKIGLFLFPKGSKIRKFLKQKM